MMKKMNVDVLSNGLTLATYWGLKFSCFWITKPYRTGYTFQFFENQMGILFQQFLTNKCIHTHARTHAHTHTHTHTSAGLSTGFVHCHRTLKTNNK